MANTINPAMINTAIAPAGGAAGSGLGSTKGAGAIEEFSSVLSNAIGHVDQGNKAAQDKIDRFLSGENEEIHETVMAVQRNELQFELFLQVRNKMVQAYQEVMRMQM